VNINKNCMISEPWSALRLIWIISVSLFSPPWRWSHGRSQHVVEYSHNKTNEMH